MRGHGLSIIGILYAAVIVGLIAAKLAGSIQWAWWIVLSPIWGPLILIVVLVLIMIVGLAGTNDNLFR
jgi:hypothetical protein